jgi:hypothetical protein
MTFIDLNPALKTSRTETHFFFLNGPFSQWHPCVFEAVLDGESRTRTFNCAEQYMMAGKAALFGDAEVLERIMAVEQKRDWREAPKAHKALGRLVKGFEADVWDGRARDVVFAGNLAKFGQAENLGKYLLATEGLILVEGTHYDPIWGVGLAWNDPAIIDPVNWQGTNWLGETLMRVRDTLSD